MTAANPPVEADQFANSMFAPHGQASATVEGRMLRIHSRGPFNLELVQAVCRMLGTLSRRLPADGRFVELLEFRTSLLMSPEAWECLDSFTAEVDRAGYTPLHTLIVVAPETEGRELFLSRLVKVYSRGHAVRVFDSLEAGERELQRLAAELG